MKTPDGKIQLPNRLNNFAEDCLSMFICLNKFYKGNKYTKIVDEGNRAMQVDLIPGSFMFSSADVFKSIGYFTHGTFLYGEEAFIAYKS